MDAMSEASVSIIKRQIMIRLKSVEKTPSYKLTHQSIRQISFDFLTFSSVAELL